MKEAYGWPSLLIRESSLNPVDFVFFVINITYSVISARHFELNKVNCQP